jgi:hypothetical protein
MDQNGRNFRAWHLDTHHLLFPGAHAGIAVLTLSMPLLEGYLRQTNGRTPQQHLHNTRMNTLRGISSALPDTATAWRLTGTRWRCRLSHL